MNNRVYIVVGHFKHIGKQFMGTYFSKEKAFEAKEKYASSDRYKNVERWAVVEQFIQDA